MRPTLISQLVNNPSFTPPVTGVNGRPSPVANNYDSTGNFIRRNRLGSDAKRKRTEDSAYSELEAMFDLSQQYPPLQHPEKPGLDVRRIRELMVIANAASTDVRAWVEEPDCEPKVKAVGNLALALLNAVDALVENGIVPVTSGRGGGGARAFSAPRQSDIVRSVPGEAELKACLEAADKETVLFDANLGTEETFNRNTLSTNLTRSLATAAGDRADGNKLPVPEARRLVDDALSCAADMEFLGNKSKKFINNFNLTDERNNTFCTLPVKFKFESGAARVNFERTMKTHCGLSAKISLPPVIRNEMKSFHKALRNRYQGKIITVRPDIRSQSFVALMKDETGWTKLNETHKINPAIMLPGYAVKEVILPDVAMEADSQRTDDASSQ
jgi:hypothetical protein